MAKKAIPSVLAFEKKLVPSDAYLFAVNWESRAQGTTPLKLQTKTVRGTISNRLKAALTKDPAKLDAEVEKANLQTVHACALPRDFDTLKLQFTLKVLSGVESPSACNEVTFSESYASAAKTYIDTFHFSKLSQRYATNIANGRFLWRNRVGAENIEVVVTHLNAASGERQWTFDAKEIGLSNFDHQSVSELAQVIAESLSGKSEFALFEVTAYSHLGRGQEVYPSEELIAEKAGKGERSKTLYEVDGMAALHSQKVGNALRTIDTWYGDEEVKPIAVESYGSVTNLGRAYRSPKDKKDFYTLFDRFGVGESLAEDEMHYVMAMLVRGGVFGLSSK